MNPILTGAIGGFLAATSVDLDAFIKARAKDPELKFDWVLAVSRWVQGAIAGALPGLGVSFAH
jgi:hypothetical protein